MQNIAVGMIRNTSDSWGHVAKFFHWTTAALVLAQIALGWLAVCWRFSPFKADLYVWHKSLGILILAVVLLRLSWRLANTTPALPANMPAWESRCARASYVVFYIVLIAMPFSGWVLNSAANVPFRIFWTLPLPALVEPSKATAGMAALAHFTFFVLLVLLVSVHIAAALRHHFVNHDEVLARMLPRFRRATTRGTALLVTLLLAGIAGPLGAAEWTMDRAASTLEFIATFERAPAPGVFRQFDTRVHLEPDKPHEARIDVTISVASADMMSAGLNLAIHGHEWFDSARFPHAEFHASEVKRIQPGAYVARGTLSLKGVQRLIEVPFSWSEAAGSALLQGEMIVKRALFGIGTGEWMTSSVVASDVTVRFNVRLRRSASR